MAAIGGTGLDVLAKQALSEAGPMQRGGAGLSQTALFDAAMARSSAAMPNAAMPQVQRIADVRPATDAKAVSDPAKPNAEVGTAGRREPAAAAPASTADAADRARRALDLAPVEKAQTASEPGDRILDGLSRIRNVFDNQHARIGALVSQPMSDADRMIGLQVEVINFSLLVEVASKLTGKSTAALETLMKG